MYSLVPTSLIVVLLSVATSIKGYENFEGTFGATPEPFTIHVNKDFMDATKLKANLTRYAVDMQIPDFEDGPPRKNATAVRDYWANEYDWQQVEDELNQKFTQFTTTVTCGANSNFTDPVPLHFVHHKSNRTDAVPLLFIHGWPGSFLEVGKIIDELTNPTNTSNPAFHVVAPSIPGFGFSPAPNISGMGPREIGQAFNNLMTDPKQLNFGKYVIQAGDWGGSISRFMAPDFPDTVVSVLSNLWIIAPNATDLLRYASGTTTADENTAIANIVEYQNDRSGYKEIESTRPLQLAIAMTDSPVGFAMWIYDILFYGADMRYYSWSPKQIITWTMMLYIQGPYGGMRIYKEAKPEGVYEGTFPFVTQPVAISEFPYDIWFGTPLDWAQRKGNVVQRVVHDRGGHFPATEVPDLLLQDCWTFWGNEELSNMTALREYYNQSTTA